MRYLYYVGRFIRVGLSFVQAVMTIENVKKIRAEHGCACRIKDIEQILQGIEQAICCNKVNFLGSVKYRFNFKEFKMKPVRIRQDAVVIAVLKGGEFRLHLQDDVNHEVLATLGGRMQKSRIGLCIGDEVTVELSPYDLHKGRVVWRH